MADDDKNKDVKSQGGEPKAPAAEATPPAAESKPPAGQDDIAPSWALGRIDGLTRQKRELEERLQAAESKLKAHDTNNPPANNNRQQLPRPDLQRLMEERRRQQGRALTQDEIDAMVNERVAQQRFAEEAQKVYENGKKDFEDFEQVMSTYKTIGGLHPNALAAAIEIGNAHKVLYTLARDPNEAYRVMQLSPAAQAAALAKISTSLGREQGGKVSKAKEPVGAVVDGNGADNRSDAEKMSDSNLSMAEWSKLRHAQRLKRAEERKAMGRR